MPPSALRLLHDADWGAVISDGSNQQFRTTQYSVSSQHGYADRPCVCGVEIHEIYEYHDDKIASFSGKFTKLVVRFSVAVQ